MKASLIALVAAGIASLGLNTPAQAQTVPPAPSPGTCFSYSEDQWQAPFYTASGGDCNTSHNGEVLAAVDIPADIAATGLGSSTMKGWAYNVCQPLAVDYVWSPDAKQNPLYPKGSFVMPRSARLYVQLPTADAWMAGANWAACLGQSRNTKLSAPQARTGSVKALGLKPWICMNPRSWKGVSCGKRDRVRLVNQVWLPINYGDAYPGTRPMLARTAKLCNQMRVKKWSLRTWYVPGMTSWDRGNKFGFCEFIKKR